MHGRGRGTHHFSKANRQGALMGDQPGKRPRPAGMQGWQKGSVLQGTIADYTGEDGSMEDTGGDGDFNNAKRKTLGLGGYAGDEQGGRGKGLREERLLFDADDNSDDESVQVHDAWQGQMPNKRNKKANAEKRQPKVEPKVELSVSRWCLSFYTIMNM